MQVSHREERGDCHEVATLMNAEGFIDVVGVLRADWNAFHRTALPDCLPRV